MKKVLFVVLGAGALACGGLTVGGCGDDTASGGAAAASGSTVTAGVTSSSSKASGSASSTHAATATGSGSTAASTGAGGNLTCDHLCSLIIANCTGENEQYANQAECVTDCTTAAAPEGTEADMGGNTMGCRVYHAGVAGSTPNPHCWHAGFPSVEPDGTTPGPCSD